MASMDQSNVIDGPVLTVINKRLRSLRKKYNRILQMEESLSQGKILNKEQEEALQSKASVMGSINELEKVKQPISAALTEEINTIECRCLEMFENQKFSMVEDVLKLVYFATMFDLQSYEEYATKMYKGMHERTSCLTYDVVTENQPSDLLSERDLDMISGFGHLLMLRPTDSSLSHQNALRLCFEQARLWLAYSDWPIGSDSCVTYAGLREKLNKIMASDYFTATPEMRAPVEVAAAAGTYGSFQVPIHDGPDVSVDVPMPVQGSTLQHEQQVLLEEEVLNPQGDGVYENQKGPIEELNQGDGCESLEFPSQTNVVQSEVEQTPQEFEKGHHYAPRRSFQSHRGGRGMSSGGRRGYQNGRGGRGGSRGGSYVNGRQYYDYPRSYYRGRGGRGASGSYPGQGSYLVGDA